MNNQTQQGSLFQEPITPSNLMASDFFEPLAGALINKYDHFHSFIKEVLQKEGIVAAYLNDKQYVMAHIKLPVGDHNTVDADMLKIVEGGTACNASFVVVGHLVTGESVEPSNYDIALYNRGRDYCRELDIAFADVTIANSKKYYSFHKEYKKFSQNIIPQPVTMKIQTISKIRERTCIGMDKLIELAVIHLWKIIYDSTEVYLGRNSRVVKITDGVQEYEVSYPFDEPHEINWTVYQKINPTTNH